MHYKCRKGTTSNDIIAGDARWKFFFELTFILFYFSDISWLSIIIVCFHCNINILIIIKVNNIERFIVCTQLTLLDPHQTFIFGLKYEIEIKYPLVLRLNNITFLNIQARLSSYNSYLHHRLIGMLPFQKEGKMWQNLPKSYVSQIISADIPSFNLHDLFLHFK